MGGYGSGRKPGGGRPVVDDALVLDIDQLKRRGDLEPESYSFGRWAWTARPSGRPVGTVGYEFETADTYGTLRLSYIAPSHRVPNGVPRDQIIDLVTTRPHFGGVRWWFECPVSGRRVRKLYGHPAIGVFASREALGLMYKVCREEPLDRAARRARRKAAKLGWREPLSEPLNLDKPKGMHWGTFNRLAIEAELAHDRYLRRFVAHVEHSLPGLTVNRPSRDDEFAG